MAEVYRAYDQALGRWRAIKILLPEYVKRPRLRARFEIEAKAMALLEHPNIVRVYDVGVVGDAPFIVMELCPGGSLEAWLLDQGPFTPQLATDCMVQVCEGISAAHAAGVVHRDIKTQNVLVGTDGVCKVTDFGIAQTEMTDFTNTGASMGTLGFMAPEQRSDAKKVDIRSDVYSIGATLYHLVTGRLPTHLFAADQDDEILAGVPESLLALIKKATEYKRELRHQTPKELAADLIRVRATLPAAAPHRLSTLRGDYTPPPVPRVKQATPVPASARGGERIGPPSKSGGDGYVISVPPELVRSDAEKPRVQKRALGAHQPPPRPEDLFKSLPPDDEGAVYAEAPSQSGRSGRSHPTGPRAGTLPPDGRPGTIPPRPGTIPPEARPQANPARPGTIPPDGRGTMPPRTDSATPEDRRDVGPIPSVMETMPPGYVEGPTSNRSRNPADAPVVIGPGRPNVRPEPEDEGGVAGFIADLLDAAAGPGRYLFIPILVLILVGTGFYVWTQRTREASETHLEQATAAFVSAMSRESAVVEDLVTAGGDAASLRTHLQEYEDADSDLERATRGRRLLRVVRDEFHRLPTATDPFTMRERRSIQQRIDRLDAREEALTAAMDEFDGR